MSFNKDSEVEYDEVVILLRNTKTGKESWMKMPQTFAVSVGTEFHYTDYDPIDFYGGLVRAHIHPSADAITTTIEVTSRHRIIGMDIEKLHYDDPKVDKYGN